MPEKTFCAGVVPMVVILFWYCGGSVEWVWMKRSEEGGGFSGRRVAESKVALGRVKWFSLAYDF